MVFIDLKCYDKNLLCHLFAFKIYLIIKLKKQQQQLYGFFLQIVFNCLKARATSRGTLLFTTKFSEIPCTHFINLNKMKA